VMGSMGGMEVCYYPALVGAKLLSEVVCSIVNLEVGSCKSHPVGLVV
jgi:hypothetical protein